MLFSICFANSLVGTNIKLLRTLFFVGSLSFVSKSFCKIGSTKAAVFPVPLCAVAITSLFLSKIGMVFC